MGGDLEAIRGASLGSAHAPKGGGALDDQVPTEISEYVSRKLKVLQFVGTVCVVYIHVLWESPVADALIAAGLLRFAVPLFFCVSGYLFFARKPADFPEFGYARRVKARLSSLCIPYGCWNVVAILMTFSWDMHCLKVERSWTALLTMWVAPPMITLWFLRDLFLMAVLSPLLLLLYNVHPKAILLPSAMAVWPWLVGKTLYDYIGVQVLCDFTAFTFFPIGGYLALRNIDLNQRIGGLALTAIVSAWLGLNVYRTVMFPLKEGFLGHADPMISVIRKVGIFVGIAAVWFLYDRVEPFLREKPVWSWCNWLSGFSMWLYCSHLPLACHGSVIIGEGMESLGLSQAWFAAFYLIYPLIVVALLINLAALTSKYCPTVYSWLSGGRGS